jgi:hypothetical protein
MNVLRFSRFVELALYHHCDSNDEGRYKDLLVYCSTLMADEPVYRDIYVGIFSTAPMPETHPNFITHRLVLGKPQIVMESVPVSEILNGLRVGDLEPALIYCIQHDDSLMETVTEDSNYDCNLDLVEKHACQDHVRILVKDWTDLPRLSRFVDGDGAYWAVSEEEISVEEYFKWFVPNGVCRYAGEACELACTHGYPWRTDYYPHLPALTTVTQVLYLVKKRRPAFNRYLIGMVLTHLMC